ncbi:MAG: isocitrate lyase/phosphoenolpyruvate mutase family protein [Chlamydiota bacterium]|nr:isocitrate lyase/phosphoenolpyruvate mutase family protein [Chlamydiota bacterium]
MKKKTTLLREMMARPSPILVAGAHDALSAKLIERSGFDGIWASGFGISASKKCLPDANFLTMTENLEAAKNMNDAVSIPVIADCDNGYGNALNVMRTVTEYENIGIAAISIEDNIFPKQCSFYPGAKRNLVSIDEMSGKIQAAKSVQTDSDFVLIARTEALIAGWGMDEALLRTRAFADAGADAILIHSKSKTSDEILKFMELWDRPVPVVVVPTTYDTISADDLYKAGCKIVIFANQAIRASIYAMREHLPVLRAKGYGRAISENIVTLEDVYDLVGVGEMKEEESRFLPVSDQNVKAVILAAGFEPQMMPLIEDRPKVMLEIKGKSILQRQIDMLQKFGIRDIAVVRGYLADQIQLPNVHYYDNPDYQDSYILHSLFCAQEFLQGRILLLYGDILFDPSILERLLRSKADISLVVDRAWTDYSAKDQVPDDKHRELVILDGAPETGYRYVSGHGQYNIQKIGEKLDKSDAHGEFIGLASLSDKAIGILHKTYHALSTSSTGSFHEADSFKKASFADMVQELINHGYPAQAIDIYKGWMEIDTFEDYKRAWAQVDV